MAEHIRYPDAKSPPPVNGSQSQQGQQAPQGQQGQQAAGASASAGARKSAAFGRQPSLKAQTSQPDLASAVVNGAPNGQRSASPAGDPIQAERAMSPNLSRPNVKPTNGVVQQPFPGGKQRPPRPKRSDEDVQGYESEDQVTLEHALSPDQRARSPSAARAVSPQGDIELNGTQPMSAAAVAIAKSAGLGGRSPSPNVDRSRPPVDGFYVAEARSSPTANGYIPNGSTGNVTADLIRDLKAKETEMEAMRKREAKMRAALAQAHKAGFVYADAASLSNGDAVQAEDGQRAVTIAVNLQQLKAQIQVSAIL